MCHFLPASGYQPLSHQLITYVMSDGLPFTYFLLILHMTIGGSLPWDNSMGRPISRTNATGSRGVSPLEMLDLRNQSKVNFNSPFTVTCKQICGRS